MAGEAGVMAEKLESFKFGRPKRPGMYPWDEWLDGSIWQLVPGTDFQVDVKDFRVQAHKAARLRGRYIRTAHPDGVLVIQAYSREEGTT